MIPAFISVNQQADSVKRKPTKLNEPIYLWQSSSLINSFKSYPFNQYIASPCSHHCVAGSVNKI
jgi:hypothetical protein